MTSAQGLTHNSVCHCSQLDLYNYNCFISYSSVCNLLCKEQQSRLISCCLLLYFCLVVYHILYASVCCFISVYNIHVKWCKSKTSVFRTIFNNKRQLTSIQSIYAVRVLVSKNFLSQQFWWINITLLVLFFRKLPAFFLNVTAA